MFGNCIHPSIYHFPADCFRIWIIKCLYIEQTLCHKGFSDIVHSVYPGMYLFMFLTECFPKDFLGEYNDIMVLSDLAKSGLESGAWIDGYNNQNKDTKKKPLRKIRVCYFFRAVYHSKNHVIPNLGIAVILKGISKL